jgi:predicted O-methyltransferase YrrM
MFQNPPSQKKTPTWVPIGHYYSPIPSVAEVLAKEKSIFDRSKRELPGISLGHERQLEVLEKVEGVYSEIFFSEKKIPAWRYYFENPFFSYTDSIFLYGIMRFLSPKRVIEVGSGFSSCALLDINEKIFDNKIRCTFLDPNPERMQSLIRIGDLERNEMIRSRVQDTDRTLFRELEPGDILFVDSTHVSKTGSDVNFIVFEILPLLAPGVWVHFHDVFYPFEYPESWVYEGRAWNEAYLLRAFLQFNQSFRIQCFIDYLQRFFEERISCSMPLCKKNGGGGLWLRKN